MKIAVDVRCLADGRRTGVEEYVLNLLSNLFQLDKKNQYVLFLNSWREVNSDFAWIEKYPNVSLKKFHWSNKILNLFFWYFHWPKIDQLVGGAEIVFLPNIIFASVSSKTKLVATIHDLSFEYYPEYFSLKRRWWHIFVNPRKICQRADKIIAVSNSTKDDLLNLYRVPSSKIEVIYNAGDKKFRVINRNNEKLIQTKEKYSLPYKFILYLGTVEPRKNIVGIIKAYNQFQSWAQKTENEELQKIRLVIAGAKGWLDEEIYKEIEKSKFSTKIKIIDFIPDENKEYVYNLASLFIYPSFFEGFGFPPLEAMQCGLPVIVSNNSSLPEIVGKAGILIEASKPDEIYRAFKEFFLNQKLQEKLKEEGLRQAKKFQWSETAKKTLAIFQQLKNK